MGVLSTKNRSFYSSDSMEIRSKKHDNRNTFFEDLNERKRRYKRNAEGPVHFFVNVGNDR